MFKYEIYKAFKKDYYPTKAFFSSLNLDKIVLSLKQILSSSFNRSSSKLILKLTKAKEIIFITKHIRFNITPN